MEIKAWGTVTLNANTTTTNVFNMRMAPTAGVFMCPLSANAAAENWWISARSPKEFTITHANAATTDRNFIYAILGGDARS